MKKKADEIFEKEIGDESSKNDDDEVSNEDKEDKLSGRLDTDRGKHN